VVILILIHRLQNDSPPAAGRLGSGLARVESIGLNMMVRVATWTAIATFILMLAAVSFVGAVG
jgi:hypothetical protein